MYELHVSGGNSAPWSVAWPYVPFKEYGDWEEARNALYTLVGQWLGDGYHLTPAGIFVKGSCWQRVVIIGRQPHTWQWYPSHFDFETWKIEQENK